MPFIHGKQTRLLLDQYDVSPYFREVSRTASLDTLDTTTFAAPDKTFIPGYVDNGVTLGGLFEASTQIGATAADTMEKHLNDIFAADPRLLTVGWNGWAVGSRVSLFRGTDLGHDITSPVGDVVTVSATLSGEGAMRNGISLHPLQAENQNVLTNGTTYDGGTGSNSTNGGIGHLHVTANARTAGSTFKIQHSTDGTTWADLITFTTIAAATTGAERIQVAGTVSRYLRATWTLGGTTNTATFNVSFARL